MTLAPGTLVAGRFRVASVLGSGGAGTVYKAIQEPLDRPVALKMLRSELSGLESVRRRFVREARAVAALSHPNIAMVLDFGESEDGQLYLAMEFVEGLSLADLFAREAPSFPDVRQIFEQLLGGLAHAHARGVVHRDIKPGNVLLTSDSDGRPFVKIVDFGIATFEGGDGPAEVPTPGRVVGTPLFMAPEQARGAPLPTAAVDVYTVGLMLYWTVTGQHAFLRPTPEAVLHAQVNDEPPPVVPRPGLAVPVDLAALIADALHKDPAERIPSAAVFRTRLRALSGVTDAGVFPTVRAPATGPMRARIGFGTGAQRAMGGDLRPSTMVETASHASPPGRAPTVAEPVVLAAPARARTLVEDRPRTLVERTTPVLGSAPVVPAGPAAAVQSARLATLVEGLPARPPARSGSAPDHLVVAPTLRPNAPFVGRDKDRAVLLQAAVAVVSSGRGRVVTIEGATGMGKSRLTRWFRDELVSSLRFREAHGVFHREGERGLRAVRSAVDRLLGVRDLQDGELDARLRSALAELGLTEPRDHQLLRRFLRPARSERQESPSQANPEALYELLLRVLERAGHPHPLLLSLDDAQFAGAETAAFLEYVASELTHRPCALLLLVTVQTDEPHAGVTEMLAQLGRFEGETVVRHRLERIGESDARELVASLLNASPELSAALVRRADGNPLHLAHLVRYLADERLLEFSPTGWRARAEVDVDHLLPQGLSDVVALRIRQLDIRGALGAAAREVLDRGAILGPRFRFSELRRMLELEERPDLLEALDAAVDLLLDEELLRMTETRGDDVLHFANALVRDVLNERLRARRTTRRLHGFAARAKIDVRGRAVDKVAGDLVQHFAEARNRESELTYAEIAAQVAERSHRPTEAVGYLERALRLLDEIGDEADPGGSRRRRTRLRVAQLALGFGNYADARRHFEAVAADIGASPEDRIAAIHGQADVVWIEGDFDAAYRLFEAGAGLARTHEVPRLLARALSGLARVEAHRGRVEHAAALADEALTAADLAADASLTADVLWLIADIARSSGDLSRAERLFFDALERFRALEDSRGIAQCHAKLAVIARMQHDLEAATRRYQSALDLYAALGARRGVAHQLNGLGDVARFRGDLSLATDHYQRAVDIFQSIGVTFDAAIALTNLGIVARDAGRFAEAAQAFARAVEVSERVRYPYLVIGAKLNWATAEAAGGDAGIATRLMDESVAAIDETGLVDPDFASPLEQLGHWERSRGRAEQALALWTRAAAMWTELKREGDAARIAALLEGSPA